MKRTLPLILTLLILSCNTRVRNGDDSILARVYDNYLYASDLHENIPRGLSVKDSLVTAKNYINNWVRQQLLIQQAERNLTDKQKDFSKQLESYRNSLITYQYESLLIQQKLDTVVHDSILENYYKNHISDFELHENILKVNFIILSADSSHIDEFRELLQSDEAEDHENLQYLCEQSAVDCYLNNQKWISMQELKQQIPVKTYDEESFLRSNSFIELRNEQQSLIYLIRILDYKMADETPPLGYEKKKIRRLIINKRKTELLKRMENEIFNAALENNKVEIY